jgi:hypothetical protein
MVATAKKKVYVDFSQEPSFGLFNTATGITAVVTTAAVNAFKTRQGHYFEIYQDGQNDQQVLTGGLVGTTGWIPAHDNAADAIEITRGINAWNGQSHFTVGSETMSIRVGGVIGTIARSTSLVCGFRNIAAYVATKGADTTALATAYNRKAVMGNATVGGVLKTLTSIASGTDVVTTLAKTALVDGKFFSFEVNIALTGAVTYRVGTGASLAAAEADLAADASAVACTIDTATVMVPTIILLGTASTGINDSALLKVEIGNTI